MRGGTVLGTVSLTERSGHLRGEPLFFACLYLSGSGRRGIGGTAVRLGRGTAPADPNRRGPSNNRPLALGNARETPTMTRPRPGRRGSSRVPASGRALLISGLLLASLLAAFARPTRGDALPMPEPAEGPVPDLAGPGRAPLLPAPEITGIAADPLDLAGTQLALLDVAPVLEPLSARLQPAPDTPLEAVSLSTPTVSGLAWRSGATNGGFDCLAR